MHLVIGGHGLVGTAVCAELERRDIAYRATTRRRDDPGMIYFDLSDIGKIPELPDAACAYLIAATPGPAFQVCEGNPVSWQINVDAQIALARRYRSGFVVFVSSGCVEWSGGTAYARQKAHVESYINAIDGGIVRPQNKVTADRVNDLARLIVDVGDRRKAGVHRWV